MIINAENMDFSALNDAIRASGKSCTLKGCMGQRFIASGMGDVEIEIDGVPGNAMGAYLSGAKITVNGNAQDAIGDTMNAGTILVRGSVGDAAGYAMRGGEIYVRDNAGYRAGIHMKEYKEKKPVIVIGGRCGSFLGEYQAGGLIIVLGLNTDGRPVVGNFPGMGMHGGKMILGGDTSAIRFPDRVTTRPMSDEDAREIAPFVSRFCESFGYSEKDIMSRQYTVVVPDTKNPYRQMYVAN